MIKNAIFTICAKNYLAQALSLRESAIKHNPDIDFFLYLSDAKDVDGLPDVIELNDDWIPNWRQMAFKYDVIEFSTSIKPFCINHLFEQGYEKVAYLDPDIYVFNSINCVWDILDEKSIMLTPHRCVMSKELKGYITEMEISRCGIYNLGFIGIKNDIVGKQVVEWWMERLAKKCYNSAEEGLFVDQKWMDFIPGFFPEQTHISHHAGLNYAIWNFYEREVVYKEGKAFVRQLSSDNFEPLCFFHFSGYSPYKKDQLDKRITEVNTEKHSYLKPLIDEYCECELRNEYEKYSGLSYSFNKFNDYTSILSINRRLYRDFEAEWKEYLNPFDSNGEVYSIFKKGKLLSRLKVVNNNTVNTKENKGKPSFKNWTKLEKVMYFIFSLLGVDKYMKLVRGGFGHFAKLENNKFLLK